MGSDKLFVSLIYMSRKGTLFESMYRKAQTYSHFGCHYISMKLENLPSCHV